MHPYLDAVCSSSASKIALDLTITAGAAHNYHFRSRRRRYCRLAAGVMTGSILADGDDTLIGGPGDDAA